MSIAAHTISPLLRSPPLRAAIRGERSARRWRRFLWARLAGPCAACAVLAAVAPARASGFDDPYGWVPATQRAPALDIVDIEWRHAMVEPRPLEYHPREAAGPTVDPPTGDVVVGTRDGALRALTEDGRELWRIALPAQATSAPLVTDERIFAGAADGKLHAIDRFSGVEVWATYLAAEALQAPVLATGTLFVGTDHDTVHALDATGGAQRWVYRREPPSELSIRGGVGVAVAGERVFAGFADGTVVALGAADGRVAWETKVSTAGRFTDSEATPVVAGGVVYVTSYSDGVLALDAATGKQRWRTAAPGAVALSLSRDLLLVGGAGRARALRAADGKELWSVDLGERAAAQPVETRGIVALATSRGLLLVERESGKPVGLFDPGTGFAAPPAVRGRTLFALSNAGALYRLRVVVGESRR